MNKGISSSYPSSHSLSDNITMLPQTIGDDENSIISWYHNSNDVDDYIVPINNYEDFIDIDMLPDTHETIEKRQDDNYVDPEREKLCLNNFKEILLSHRTIFRENSRHVANRSLNEADRSAIVKSKSDYSESFANTTNICCYNEGISALLQIFNRIDCFVQQYSETINDCRCTRQEGRRYISQIRYALETGGDKCQQCSMDYILENLNNNFLANVAKAQFFTVKEIIEFSEAEEEIKLGATSSCFNQHPSDNPETGWLRKWIMKYLEIEAVVAIIYSEMDNQRNKLYFRIIDYYSEQAFHLTIPMETVTDDELERRLLQEETVFVLKSEMLGFEHRASEFESLVNHGNERVHEMNVLGQIVGMFREQTVENFRDVSRPKGVHMIKVPNMHRHGVLVVVPLPAGFRHAPNHRLP